MIDLRAHGLDERDGLELGLCCACRERPAVGISMLNVRAPTPGTGWGCLVCGLPSDGAIAVLCETCGPGDAEILDVVAGYPKDGKRIALTSCTVPFEHHFAEHERADLEVEP